MFKTLLLAVIASLMSAIPASWAGQENLPPVEIVNSQNLQADGQLSQQEQKPLLIFFSMDGCTYCQFVEEEHLKPMLRNKKYRSEVIIRRVKTDSFDELVDFDGTKISSLDFSARYGAYVTPTIVFVDHTGKELTSRILGVQNTEFYGGELDQGLEISLHKIRKQLAKAEKAERF
jgi:thioredoxin-related protein